MFKFTYNFTHKVFFDSRLIIPFPANGIGEVSLIVSYISLFGGKKNLLLFSFIGAIVFLFECQPGEKTLFREKHDLIFFL